MVSIPANVISFLKRPESVKVMSTSSSGGVPHVIVCGSVSVIDEGTLAVGEVMMRVTSENLRANGLAEFLVVNGADAYQIDAKVREYQTEGETLDELNVKLDRKHLKAKALWVFDVTGVTVASASHEAGKKIA